MTNQADVSPESNQISQSIRGDRNQSIGQVYGGIVVYVSGGQAIINAAEASTTPELRQSSQDLGPNPYKGLLAFNENDGDRYFGRSDEIKTLWEKFRDLYGSEGKTRLLPIYGPSGSGKSSLARAGLLPELGRRPLPGREQARVAVMVPGKEPLQSLAVALAKVATDDPNPVEKADEFKRVLEKGDESRNYTGLNRIAYGFPNIANAPLIILIDQFEEIYAYEPKGTSAEDQQQRVQFIAKRDAFLKNLIYAASELSQYVSAIITCRIDFIEATQEYPEFNKLFSTQGFLVPIMQPEGLAVAIAEPAKQAGYEFDLATVQLLVEQTRGYQGALPLLQFALQRIWEGLERGCEPLETLNKIGGVGGALAEEAQKLYHSLSEAEQKIAPRIFVALVQVDETSAVSRRRARTAELITSENDAPQVDAIIKQFAARDIRFLVISFTEEDGEVIEVAHEALIQNWQQLQKWIDEFREALRKKRKIEQAAQEWEQQANNPGYLLQGRPLRDACEFLQSQGKSIETLPSRLAKDFVNKSTKKQLRSIIKYASIFSVFPFLGTLVALHIYILGRANVVLWSEDCSTRPEISFLIKYMIVVGQKNRLEGIHLCQQELGSIDLSEAELFGASFEGSSFSEANFQSAYLERADFQGTFLYRVNFKEADLREANFQNSILYKTNFLGAKNLIESQLETATLCETLLPEEISIPSDRDCENLLP